MASFISKISLESSLALAEFTCNASLASAPSFRAVALKSIAESKLCLILLNLFSEHQVRGGEEGSHGTYHAQARYYNHRPNKHQTKIVSRCIVGLPILKTTKLKTFFKLQ